jgi:hypothetical protein
VSYIVSEEKKGGKKENPAFICGNNAGVRQGNNRIMPQGYKAIMTGQGCRRAVIHTCSHARWRQGSSASA